MDTNGGGGSGGAPVRPPTRSAFERRLRVLDGTDGFFGARKDEFLDAVADRQSLRRTLETGDLTGTVVYLTSDASRLVTGRTIMVDGGTVFL